MGCYQVSCGREAISNENSQVVKNIYIWCQCCL